MTRSEQSNEQSPSFSVSVSQMMTQETMVWTNMPSRKEGWMERGKKKEKERLIIEGGGQITHKWQSYGYGTLDNESEWCVLTHRNPSSLGWDVRSYFGQGFERQVCVCVCERNIWGRRGPFSVTFCLHLANAFCVNLWSMQSFSDDTKKHIHFCHHSASCQTKPYQP